MRTFMQPTMQVWGNTQEKNRVGKMQFPHKRGHVREMNPTYMKSCGRCIGLRCKFLKDDKTTC